MEFIDEITLDDSGSPDVLQPNPLIPQCWEVTFKEKTIANEWHVASASTDGQNGTGKYDVFPAGQPKTFRAESFPFTPSTILGYGETLTGAGSRTFVRICRTR